MRHVVWDWNGTLLDDHEHCIRIINRVLEEEGLPLLDVEAYRRVFDFPVRRYYERLGLRLDGGRWELLAARFIEEYERQAAELRLHEGAPELLATLGGLGVESTILSAARTVSIEEALGRYGIREHFGDVVGLDDHYARGKVELGLEWFRRRALDPEGVLFVGDTAHDAEVARAMGVRCVLVAQGHHSRERLETCECEVVDRLLDLVS